MKLILAKLIKNLVAMLLTEKMIIWGLQFATKQTKNKIDDNVVGIVIAGYKGDEEEMKKAIEALVATLGE